MKGAQFCRRHRTRSYDPHRAQSSVAHIVPPSSHGDGADQGSISIYNMTYHLLSHLMVAQLQCNPMAQGLKTKRQTHHHTRSTNIISSVLLSSLPLSPVLLPITTSEPLDLERPLPRLPLKFNEPRSLEISQPLHMRH